MYTCCGLCLCISIDFLCVLKCAYLLWFMFVYIHRLFVCIEVCIHSVVYEFGLFQRVAVFGGTLIVWAGKMEDSIHPTGRFPTPLVSCVSGGLPLCR